MRLRFLSVTSPSLFCLYRNKLECCHIKQSHICQFELRDHCKRHKAKCHDRLHFPTDSKFCISFLMNLCQFLVHPFPTSVTHQSCDRSSSQTDYKETKDHLPPVHLPASRFPLPLLQAVPSL